MYMGHFMYRKGSAISCIKFLGNVFHWGVPKSWAQVNECCPTLEVVNIGNRSQILWRKTLLSGTRLSKYLHLVWSRGRQPTSSQSFPWQAIWVTFLFAVFCPTLLSNVEKHILHSVGSSRRLWSTGDQPLHMQISYGKLIYLINSRSLLCITSPFGQVMNSEFSYIYSSYCKSLAPW